MRQASENNTFKTSIGGQALMEGVMMRGPGQYAMAVRQPDGQIQLEVTPLRTNRAWYARCPLVRGIYSFVSSIVLGYKCLMRSAEISGQDDGEEEINMGAVGAISAVASVLLCLALFMALPTVIVGFIGRAVPLGHGAAVLESAIKLGIFVLYMVLISRMEEIHRVFMCHGAEHKTIACYEHGKPLTVENVRTFSRFHPRCGTSFLLIVLVVSIVVSLFLSRDNLLLRVVSRVLLLPVVMGISYEILRFAGRHDNPLTRIISAPGMWLQHLTVAEPEDGMIECAIAAIQAVIPGDGSDKW